MAPRIRICYLLNAFAVGGAETVALNLARKLPPDEFDVTVASIFEPDPTRITPMRQRFLDDGIRVDAMNLGNFRNPLTWIRFWSYLRSRRFEIIHGHNRPSDSWGVRIGARAGIPHRLWTRHLVYRDMTPRKRARYRRLSRQAPVVLAVSDSVRENCINYEGIAADKVRTVVNGIDTERIRPLPAEEVASIRADVGVAGDEMLLLFVGRLAEQKAPEAFVQLVSTLRGRGLPVRGLMCGAGPLADKVASLAGPESGVRLLGLRDDVPRLLAAADLFVSVSRNEGLPLNVMEAMTAGAPVAAPDIGQISCLFEGYPILSEGLYRNPPAEGDVPQDLIDEWADSVAGRLADPQKLKEQGAAGRRAIEAGYSLDHMVAVHARLYHDLVQRPGASSDG